MPEKNESKGWYTHGEAHSAAQYAKLKEFYRQMAKYGSAEPMQLENGRYRFYGEVKPARTPGEMMVGHLVREWDPATGATRTWYETLDHQGTTRIVHPKYNDLPHYTFDAEERYVGTRYGSKTSDPATIELLILRPVSPRIFPKSLRASHNVGTLAGAQSDHPRRGGCRLP
jgi:hypothetical protein